MSVEEQATMLGPTLPLYTGDVWISERGEAKGVVVVYERPYTDNNK